MQFTTVSGAAVLLALASTVLSVGTAHVVNNCDFDVYYASVAQNTFPLMAKLPAGGFSEVYSLPGVGVSIKLAKSAAENPTQFEFTWADGKINYDISNINGNPFEEYGTSLVPSMAGDSGYPSCQAVSCPAGVSPCTAAYNQPDDTKTMVCDQASDLVMTLCTSGSSLATKSTKDVEASTSVSSSAVAATTTSHKSHKDKHGRHHARHLPQK